MKTKLIFKSLSKEMRSILFMCFALMTSSVFAQPFPKSSKYKVGMTAGLNYTWITGTELKNPSPRTSVVLGASFRQKLSTGFHLGAELNASFRGSNFNNGQTDAYHAIKFIYLDLPVNAMINMSGKSEKQYLTFGLEPSYLLKSEIYVKPDNIKARYRDFGFTNFDVAAVVGYHFDFYYFGFRPSIRVGLLDINDDLVMPNVFPETGTGGTIKNMTIDLKLYF